VGKVRLLRPRDVTSAVPATTLVFASVCPGDIGVCRTAVAVRGHHVPGQVGLLSGEGFVKRVLAVLVAAVSAVSLAGFDGASAAPRLTGAGAGTEAAAGTAYVPTLHWAGCGGGSTDQCARFAVPLDWRVPDGEKITLAVRKREHTSSTYRGVMLTNPGGPGASGTGLVVLSDYVPGGVGHQYDWIGFDPRGVGASSPALRCNTHYFGVDRPSFVPRTKRLMRFWVRKTERYAAQCGASAAKRLLPHMSTMDTVLDMEALRQALDVPTISFYGFSYGSYLGQVYATNFPQRVGHFVLDGVVDPTTYWYGANLRQEVGFDRNLNVFFRWVARHPRAYHLGRDWRAIRHGYDRLLKKLDRRPAYHGRLGPDELTDAMLDAGYYVFNWDSIAAAYSRLVRKGHGGALFAMYRSANMGDDNGYAVYLGVQCSDVRRPAWRTQVRDAWRIHRTRPFLAWDNTWFNAPCRTWSAPSHARLAVSGARVKANILLVNETRDAATPYSGALRVRSLFPSARLIAGVRGTTHAGSLNGVSCVDQRIAAYLNSDGTNVPARLSGTRADVRCPKVPPPAATGGWRIGTDGLRAAVRRQVVAAERLSLR
jgi:pimeloyl-ACP methyl ester carboxylesterase